MKRTGLIAIIIAILGLSTSCKKESISDYISFRDDTINNPNGLLEDYGEPFKTSVNLEFFRRNSWTVTVITKVGTDAEYSMIADVTGLKVYAPATPGNYYFANFSSGQPYKAPGQYAQNEMDFSISNGDKRLSGRWFKYGSSDMLIMAGKEITLVFTRL